jgi:hypothetical protein
MKTTADSTVGPNPRLGSVSKFIETIESSKTHIFSEVEKSALEKARQQLQRVEAARAQELNEQARMEQPANTEFADRFLDFFVSDAFQDDLDALRQREGTTMSDSDFATLADSIRSFGLGISEEQRFILTQFITRNS